jgi:Ras-related protein Rab-18
MTHQFKVVLAGDASCGKSSIVLRITESVFENLPPTIGCDFKKHETMSSTGERVNLIMWDTAGEEKYQSIMSSYYRGAHAVILVYDVTNRNSFHNIERLWLEQVDLYCNRGAQHCVLMLLANKTDLVDSQGGSERAVAVEEGLALAQRKGMIFGECSSKSNTGLQEAITALADRLLAVNAHSASSSSSSQTVKLEDYSSPLDDPNQGTCYC